MAQDRFGFEALLRNKKAVAALQRARALQRQGKSLADIRKTLRAENAGAAWLDLLIQFLPVLLKLLEKLLDV